MADHSGHFRDSPKTKWPLKADETKEHLQRLKRVMTKSILSLVTIDVHEDFHCLSWMSSDRTGYRTRDIASQISSLRSFLMESCQERGIHS